MSMDLTIPQLAVEAAACWPDALAVIDGEQRVTFRELEEKMREAAAAFVAAGLQSGERVSIWLPNSLDWIVACLGLQAAGGILVPLNTRFRAGEAQYILARSKASMLVLVDEFLGNRYADMIADLELPDLRRVVHIGTSGKRSWENFLAGADAASRMEARRRLTALPPESAGDIMFTSGTTGNPKGAVTAHQQTVRTARLWAKSTGLAAGDRFLVLWPFFHCSGYKGGWVVCLAVGATILPQRQLEVAELIATVEREAVTFLPGPPTLFQALLSSPGLQRSALRSVRVSVTGASSIGPSLIAAVRDELGIPIVLTAYGLTETCGTATMTNARDSAETVAKTCGRAIEGIEVAILDADGVHQTGGEPGEVVIRGMNVMKEYLDDPDATAEAIDAEGWLHTGDIGVLDESGYLRITDRMKDMFIVGGFNCYPVEIERALLSHPDIMQVAVTGMPDERLGEVGQAHVVLRPGAKLDAQALVAWSRERMANYKVPRSIQFVSELPMTATGKVQKFKLRSSSLPPPPGFEPLPSRSPFVVRAGEFFIHREQDGTSTVGTWVKTEQSNSEGFAHGGFLLAFADFAITIVTMGITMNLSADFIRPARTGTWLQARVIVRKKSESVVFADAIITDGRVDMVRVSALLRPFEKRT
jgi:acyl-CoA synthetase (AMP-forming)/AMP-acid ligase II/acyl-coenzyme A thioesterase PaaI-like protein